MKDIEPPEDLVTLLIMILLLFVVLTLMGFVLVLALNFIGINIVVNLTNSFLVGIAIGCINGMKDSLFPE